VNVDRDRLELTAELLGLGVPADALAEAMRLIESGSPVREALAVIEDACALDAVLREQAATLVRGAEAAVRARSTTDVAKVSVRRSR